MNLRTYMLVLLMSITVTLIAQKGESTITLRIKTIDQLYTSKPDIATQLTYDWYDSLKTCSKIDPVDEGIIYYALCKYEFRRYNYTGAFQICKKGVAHLDKYQIKEGLGGFYNILGTSFMGTNQLDSGIFYFIKGADNLVALGDMVKAGYMYNNLGNVYFDNQDFKKALPYLQKSLHILEDKKDTINIITVKGNVSYCYVMLDSLVKGEQIAKEAIALGQRYNEINGVVYGYLSLADIKNKQSKTNEAISLALRGYNYAASNSDPYYKGLCASSLAGYYLDSIPMLTIKYGEEALKIFKVTEPRFIPQLQVTLSRAYMETGDFKNAAFVQNEYIAYLDSTKNETYNRTQLELLEKYESAEKSRTIAVQQNAIITKDLNLSRVGLALLFTLLMLGLGLWKYKLNQLKNKAKINRILVEKEAHISQAAIKGEVQERERLAKELHDGVSNDLAASKLLVSAHRMMHKDNSDLLIQLENQLEDLHKNTRTMAHNLLPHRVLSKGLPDALRAMIADYQSNISIQLVVDDYLTGKSQSLELYIYRIVQELVMNAIKHADATHIYCKIQDDTKNIIITVRDNGKGMTSEEQSQGLVFLRSRIQEVGGTLDIASVLNQGTQIITKLNYGA